MSEEQQQAPPNPEQAVFAAAVQPARLADYCAESPQAWFRCIASTFAIANITSSKTKFHMAVAKLPIALMDSIGHLCDNPNRVPVRSHREWDDERVTRESSARLTEF